MIYSNTIVVLGTSYLVQVHAHARTRATRKCKEDLIIPPHCKSARANERANLTFNRVIMAK